MDGDKVVGSSLIALQGFLRGRFIDIRGTGIIYIYAPVFQNPANREIVERLRAAGLQMEIAADSSTERSDKLNGKTIVISGVFTKHSRDEYKELIESNGGKNSGSISKKTDFILAGANMGPAKLEKAKKLGVPVIDEDTFLNMIAD